MDRGWIAGQARDANRVFAPAGVAFRVTAITPLDAKSARMESRRDRHALGAFTRPAVVNCFVVASLRDVDEPGRFRYGVHWRSRAYRGRHYVIISKIAGANVLGHELGHFFGNRRHSDVPGNIMSYTWGPTQPGFDPDQIQTVRDFVQRYLSTGALRGLAEPATSSQR